MDPAPYVDGQRRWRVRRGTARTATPLNPSLEYILLNDADVGRLSTGMILILLQLIIVLSDNIEEDGTSPRGGRQVSLGLSRR